MITQTRITEKLIKAIFKEYVDSLGNLVTGQLDRNLVRAALAKFELNYLPSAIILQSPDSGLYKEIFNLAKENAVSHWIEKTAKLETIITGEMQHYLKTLKAVSASQNLHNSEQFSDIYAWHFQSKQAQIQDMQAFISHQKFVADFLEKFFTLTDSPQYVAFREKHFLKPLKESARLILERCKQKIYCELEAALTKYPESFSDLARELKVEKASKLEQIKVFSDHFSKYKFKSPISNLQKSYIENTARACMQEYNIANMIKMSQESKMPHCKDISQTKNPVMVEENIEEDSQESLINELEDLSILVTSESPGIEIGGLLEDNDLTMAKKLALLDATDNVKSSTGESFFRKAIDIYFDESISEKVCTRLHQIGENYASKVRAHGLVAPKLEMTDFALQFIKKQHTKAS